MSDTSSFTEGPDLPEERFLQCATVLPDGRVFTAAGYDGKDARARDWMLNGFPNSHNDCNPYTCFQRFTYKVIKVIFCPNVLDTQKT